MLIPAPVVSMLLSALSPIVFRPRGDQTCLPRGSVVTAFAAFLGADIEVLSKCPPENQTRLAAFGGALLVAVTSAAGSGAYVTGELGGNYLVSTLAGLLWGAFIYGVDRALLSETMRGGGLRLHLAVLRLVIGLATAGFIGQIVMMQVFDPDIAQILELEERSAKSEELGRVRARYASDRQPYLQQRARLEERRADAEGHAAAAAKEATDEVAGRGASGHYGVGPAYRAILRRAHDAKRDRDKVVEQIGFDLQLLEQNLKDLESREAAELREIKERPFMKAGLLRRKDALDHIVTQSKGAALLYWLMHLVLIALEATPTLLKSMARQDAYSTSVLHAENEHELDLEEATAQTKLRRDDAIRFAQVTRKRGELDIQSDFRARERELSYSEKFDELEHRAQFEIREQEIARQVAAAAERAKSKGPRSSKKPSTNDSKH